MDFDLNDEQRSIQETVREFVDRRILPVAQENDINHHLDMAGVRPRTRSGGAQSARITFWSRWAERSEESAMCSSGESRPIAISARPAAKQARRQTGV